MRQRFGVGFGLVLALAGMAGEALAQATAAKTDPALNKLAKEFSVAFNAKDAAKTSGFYAEDALINPPNEAAVRGRTAIQAWFKTQFDQGLSNLVLTPTESSISGTLGYEAGTYSLSVKPPTGPAMTDKGKYVEVFKLVGGKWLLAHDIFNSDMPPPPPAPAKSPAK